MFDLRLPLRVAGVATMCLFSNRLLNSSAECALRVACATLFSGGFLFFIVLLYIIPLTLWGFRERFLIFLIKSLHLAADKKLPPRRVAIKT